jgi:hypothetical protein
VNPPSPPRRGQKHILVIRTIEKTPKHTLFKSKGKNKLPTPNIARLDKTFQIDIL